MFCDEGKLLRYCLVYKARHKKPNLSLHKLHNMTICDNIIRPLSKKEKSTLVFVINIMCYNHKNSNLGNGCFIKLYF